MSFAALVAETLKDDGSTARRIRGMGLSPVEMRSALVAAIERLNPADQAESVLLGDVMALYRAARTDIKAGGVANDSRETATEMGKRTLKLLQLDAGLGVEWTEAIGRVMRVVWSERLHARAKARQSGDIRRVAQHVGWAMEHLGQERKLAAEKAVLDHGITHARMVRFVNAGETRDLFYGPEIRNGNQTKDLGAWCEIMGRLVEDADYIAEVEASGNEEDYEEEDYEED